MQRVITAQHKRARRIVRQLELRAERTADEQTLDRILDQLEEARLGERLAASANWRA